MASGDMSRRAHLWLRLSAIAVIAAAAAIPRASGVAERPVAPALTASSGVVETGSRRLMGQLMDEALPSDGMGASVMTVSAMNVLPAGEAVTDTVTDALTDALAVRSPGTALDAPLRKDAKPPVARR